MPDADLHLLRETFADDTSQWSPIREAGAEDIAAIAGDPWDPKERDLREKAKRPVITLDELSQYVNQVINDLRSNKRAVQFAPVGNGANDETASFYADKMREIEYRSRASIGYITAAENAIQRSYGFVRVSTRYEHPRSVNQDLWIDPVHDPDAVTPDPDAVMPDLSDMRRCWVRQPFTHEDFARHWPKAEIRSFGDFARDFPSWVDDKRVWVAEHWCVETTTRRLLIVQPPVTPPVPGPNGQPAPPPGPPEPEGVFADEIQRAGGLPTGYRVLREREVDWPQVYQELTNGLELLGDRVRWPGKYIPIVGCLGKILYVNGERQILSMVRLARSPQQLLNYYASCEAELVGMTPKFPYFYYRGTLNPDALYDIQKSLHEPVAAIPVDPFPDGMPPNAPPLPPPMRQPYEPPIQAIEVGKESARRAIQAAMAQYFLPTIAQRKNEKSGVALKQIEDSSQRGSYHFKDHFEDMITHVGVICEDLIDKIYDSARTVGIRKANDDAETIRINDPAQRSVRTTGDHLVTISTGPSQASEREAASDFADTLAQISPQVFALLGPLIVKLKNLGPIGDEMAELLESLQPPQVIAARDAKKQTGGDPKQAMQQLAQLQAQVAQLTQAAQAMKQELDTDAAKQRGMVEKAKIDGAFQLKLQEMRNAATIRVAEIAAAAKGYLLEAQHAADHEDLALGHAHEATENDENRAHEMAMAAMGHTQATDQADQAHQQALEQGEQGADLAMTQAEHAQAMAPEPEQAGA